MTVRMPVTTLGPGGPVVSRIGMGLAALGRPAYITTGRAHDLTDRSVPAMRARTFCVLDAAYDGGVRYVDAARSYGRAEDFLAGWLADRGHADVVVGSKWGYRYTGGWRLDAAQQEVKEHSLAMFTTQLGETRALLRDRLPPYQGHSLTPDSRLLGDRGLLAALAPLPAGSGGLRPAAPPPRGPRWPRPGRSRRTRSRSRPRSPPRGRGSCWRERSPGRSSGRTSPRWPSPSSRPWTSPSLPERTGPPAPPARGRERRRAAGDPAPDRGHGRLRPPLTRRAPVRLDLWASRLGDRPEPRARHSRRLEISSDSAGS